MFHFEQLIRNCLQAFGFHQLGDNMADEAEAMDVEVQEENDKKKVHLGVSNQAGSQLRALLTCQIVA